MARLCLSLALTLAPFSLARAEGPPASHDTVHEGWLFGRAQVGLMLQLDERSKGDGMGVGGDFDLGVKLLPNLFLFAEYSARETVGIDATLYGASAYGLGLSYYGPSNFFVSGTFHLFKATWDDHDGGSGRNTSGDLSDRGLGGSLAVGKEWWGRGLGSGLSLIVSFARAPRPDATEWTGFFSCMLAWSNTVNLF